jgi:6-phosphogluconolactonase
VTSLTTCADAEAASRRAAVEIARRLQSARHERGVAHLALSGGSTPARTYELLAKELENWDRIEVWFADERCVGSEDQESNFRLAKDTLLGAAAGLTDGRVHRMEGELGPERGAQGYALALRERVPMEEDPAEASSRGAARASEPAQPGRGGGLPALDLIVLGIGPDGHVASLFPGAATLDADGHEVCLGVHDSPKPPPERITLSMSVLHAARRCLLLATGAGKADAVNAMLADPTRHVPASLLRRGRLSVIMDDSASPTPLRR